jgi:hypothetical protein
VALYPVAGSKIYIGGVLADKATDFVASDYSGQSWTEIDGWKSAGKIGDSAQVITTSLINRGRDLKQKGTSNAGSMQNEFAIITSDAGQIAVRAAAAGGNKSNYAFKIAWQNGTTDYFIALATSTETAGGEANTILMLSVNLELNSNIVTV